MLRASWAKVLGLIILLLFVVALLVALAIPGGVYDCDWVGIALAWLDENENGRWDEGEPPLSSVPFFVDNIYYERQDVSEWAMSNTWGEAHLYVRFPSCPRSDLKVYPEVPAGYRLTTADRLEAQEELGEVFEFGFTLLPGVPTPTPRPSIPLACASYSPDPTQYWFFNDLIIAPDATVWGTSISGVFRFDLSSSNWTTYTTKSKYIQAMVWEPDGLLWVETTREMACFDGTAWTTYTLEAGSTLDGIDKLAFESDGDVWRISGDGLTKIGVVTPDGSLWSAEQSSLSQSVPARETNAASDWIVYEHSFPDYHVFRMAGPIGLVGSVDGTLWLSGQNGQGGWGLANFDPSTRGWAIYDPRTTHGALLGDRISFFAVGSDGSVWADASRNGLVQLVPAQTGQVEQAQIVYHTPDVLLDQKILAFALAPDGSLWLGTEHSLIRCVAGDG